MEEKESFPSSVKRSLGTIGEFGELLVTTILQKLEVHAFSVGRANYPYDIIVPFKNPLFKRPAAIAVVTRKYQKKFFKDTPPRKEKFYKAREALAKEGYDYWIAWVFYSFDEEKRKLGFKIYLIPAEIVTDDWFILHGKGSESLQISNERVFSEARKKDSPIIVFSSDVMNEP